MIKRMRTAVEQFRAFRLRNWMVRHVRPRYLLYATAIVGGLLLRLAAESTTTPYWQGILINMGTGLLGAVVTYYLLDFLLQRFMNADGRSYEKLSYTDFAGQVKRSRTQVRILTTFLYPLTTHLDYEQERKELVGALNDVIRQQKEKIEVQILILDPTSEAAKQRNEERADDDIILRIQENLSEFQRLREEPYHRASFQHVNVKLFDRLPPLALFQSDDRASMAFYPRHMKISDAARFEFSMGSPLGKFMTKTFDNLWDDEKTKKLDDYISLALHIEHIDRENVIERRVHFVEDGPGVFYLLLRKDGDADTLALLTGDLQGLRIGIRRHGIVRPCTCSELSVSTQIVDLSRRKYGSFPYQNVVRVCTLPPAADV
ncbi:MAG TPA: hypothetical protein VHG91_16430 [Longimicrobium sp.]|nr:hypothetical protein [Longimicrobium sp.]